MCQRLCHSWDSGVKKDVELVLWMAANPQMVAEKVWMPVWRSPLLRYCLRRKKDFGKERMPLVKELG